MELWKRICLTHLTDRYPECLGTKQQANYEFAMLSDSMAGFKNPLYQRISQSNLAHFKTALSNYQFDTSRVEITGYSIDDSERIFADIEYWKKDMDSTGHMIVHRSSAERDTLMSLEIFEHWKNFHNEFGQCFVSYKIPMFDSTYQNAIFNWSFACDRKHGKGFYGLLTKENGKWKHTFRYEVWNNEKYILTPTKPKAN